MDRKNKEVLTLDDWLDKERGRITGRMGELGRSDMSGRLPEVEALVRKVLSDQSDGGKGISRRESGELARMLRQMEAISPVTARRNWKRLCP